VGKVTAEVVRCANCSAPLSGAGEGTVTCTYCGTENRLRAAEVPGPAPTYTRPSAPRFAALEAPSPADDALTTTRSGGRTLVVVFLTAVVLVAAVVFLSTRGSSPGKQDAPAAARLISWSYATHGLCLVDVDGDGVADPVLGTFTSNGNELTAFDARTGRTVWTTPFPGEQPGLWCAAGSIFVEKTGFVVERRDAKNGAVLFSAKLTDKISWIAASASCVRFASADGANAYFDLAGAPITSCTPTAVLDPLAAIRRSGHFTSGELDLEVRRTGSGTPRTLVVATRAGKPAWQTTLEIMPEIIDPAATLTPDGLFVFGKKPGDAKIAAYALVRADGTVAFQKEDATLGVDSAGVAVNVAGVMATTGGLVILASGQGCAIDLSSGRVAWRSP
jgi:outer membrane protein assembly factor BamB